MKTFHEFIIEHADTGLDLTDTHRESAKSNKMHSLVRMHPKDFLKLTTSNDDHYNEIKGAARSLSDYNKYAREGSNVNAPHLGMDHRGKVVSHEGRHRAAALVNAGHDTMHVYLKGPAQRDDIPERWHGHGDIHHTIHNQYGNGFKISKPEDVVQDHVAKLDRPVYHNGKMMS